MRNDSQDPQAWMRYAAEDLRTAELALTDNPPLLRSANYHAQQAAEKSLKAALIAHHVHFPRTHDLELLWKLCQQRDPTFADIRECCEALNQFSSEVRYPLSGMDEPTVADARKALRFAEQVAIFIKQHLPPN